jgi:hypothetical protein
MFIEHRCPPCPLCGEQTIFTVDTEALAQWQSGRLIQDCFMSWSDEDRETLKSGYCPRCWELAFPEDEEDDWQDEEDLYTAMELLDPESDLFEYERDWYVD